MFLHVIPRTDLFFVSTFEHKLLVNIIGLAGSVVKHSCLTQLQQGVRTHAVAHEMICDHQVWQVSFLQLLWFLPTSWPQECLDLRQEERPLICC